MGNRGHGSVSLRKACWEEDEASSPRPAFFSASHSFQFLAVGWAPPPPAPAQPLGRLTHWSGVMSWQLTTTPARVRRLWHR